MTASGHAQPDDPGQVLQAEPGDTLVFDGAGVADPPRTGTIIAVTGRDGTPPYLVHWTAGDYQSRITPGPGARIEKHPQPLPDPGIPAAGDSGPPGQTRAAAAVSSEPDRPVNGTTRRPGARRWLGA